MCSDVGGLSMGRGSECSDPCEKCWGTENWNQGSDGCKSGYCLYQASDPN